MFRFVFVSYQMEMLLKTLLLNDEMFITNIMWKGKIENVRTARLTLTFENDREITEQFTVDMRSAVAQW